MPNSRFTWLRKTYHVVNGIIGTAADIYNLAGVWGWPRWTRGQGKSGGPAQLEKNYLWGWFPMGDAFLAWGMSQEAPQSSTLPSPGKWAKLRSRWPFFGVLAGLFGLLGLREGFAIRKSIRRRQAGRGRNATAGKPDEVTTGDGDENRH